MSQKYKANFAWCFEKNLNASALIIHPDQSFPTAADTVRVMTDAGAGYLKAMGNRGGPHRLASDYVATQFARWLGLATFDFAIVGVSPENEIPFYKGGHAQAGPAFITRMIRA